MKTPLYAVAILAIFPALAANVTTLIGTGMPGFSGTQVNNPYGMAIGPDGAMYFCDVDNQRFPVIDACTGKAFKQFSVALDQVFGASCCVAGGNGGAYWRDDYGAAIMHGDIDLVADFESGQFAQGGIENQAL